MRAFAGGAAVCLLSLLLSGCGVPLQDEPHRIDRARSTSDPGAPDAPSAETGQRDATIFLVRGSRLEPVRRVVQRSDGAELLRSLFGGPADAERRLGIRSAIPPGTTSARVTRSGSVAVVEVPEQIGRAGTEDQVLAVAQIVFTLTATDGVRSVQLTRSGSPAPARVGDGRLVTRPLTRADFSERAPDG